MGRLPVEPLANSAAFWADSVFENFTEPMSRVLSDADFTLLKSCIRKGMIKPVDARSIFGELKVDSTCTAKGLFDSVKKGNVYLQYYPFGGNKSKFDEFGILVGDAGHCDSSELYFFKGNKIIAKQSGYSRYTDNVQYFKNVDGESIVYRRMEFNEGSGIWWFNSFFYKYDGDKLIPVLNELKNSNLLQPSPWGIREIWLESTIQHTNPLVMKVVYHQQFQDTTEFDHYEADPKRGPMIVNDSTLVKYTWNAQTKKLEAQLESSKINTPQVLSYYLVDNELLFINAYHQRLKKMMLNKKKKRYILHYLNNIKNYQNEPPEHLSINDTL
ncbi:hypothetical protein [Mucilaginibacter rubeus]|uniref:Uncharacterized protein n=1 Tax=Mucilaginibacter rubeus TaxID=2027860 RepID=A0A5C1I4B6_9SPHI|nr:hypothetical protein [Mucilaginibacter rubeus]QEM12160.1 hypothetical protein DEO27_019725 [Mucilaginibacter rubeus]